MLTRVLEQKIKLWWWCPLSPKHRGVKGEQSNHFSLHPSDEDQEGLWGGPGGDPPLTFCGRGSRLLGLREVLRSSVEVLGMSGFGVTEKVVLCEGSTFAAKRFRELSVGRLDFGQMVEKVAAVCAQCDNLVPVRAYLYSKRTKLVLCDYYPMGSLADLLAGARERGHTPLDWNQRAKIILHVARAISYIHSQPLAKDTKRLRTNIHGNLKLSNVFIGTNFSARVSDYGFTQLAYSAEVTDNSLKLSSTQSSSTSMQKTDVLNFGMMVLDVLGGSRMQHQIHCIVEKMEDIRAGRVPFFEYFVEGEAKMQALKMLEVALACTNISPEDRPSADNILQVLTGAQVTGA